MYVPYCTGDVHAGNRKDATVSGVTGKQQFVGYVNVANDLKRIVPSFPGLTKVLLTGVSAGGFGAASNYVQMAKAFGSVPVYELDDSGPPDARSVSRKVPADLQVRPSGASTRRSSPSAAPTAPTRATTRSTSRSTSARDTRTSRSV